MGCLASKQFFLNFLILILYIGTIVFLLQMEMGRDVTGIRTDKKPNPITLKPGGSISQEPAHVSPKISRVEEIIHRLDVETKNTNSKGDSYILKKTDSPVKGGEKEDDAILKPQDADDATLKPRDADKEPMAKAETLQNECESSDSTEKITNEIKELDVPSHDKKSQLPISPRGTTKPPQSDTKKQVNEEDNFAVESSYPLKLSKSTSAKSFKFKTTIPVAPVFKCVARAEQRKQFYSKLEEKQAAMEVEKLENETRIKEKEQAVIRQLRKKMVFKANPMPSFYQEGPPRKTELKKVPVTRAKSPKLNRRKSCGDVMRGISLDDKRTESQQTVRLS